MLTGVDPIDDPFNVFNLPDLASSEVERLRDHVAQLAEDLGVEWREEDVVFLEAEGDLGEDWFVSPPIRHEFDYLVGLHEVGHHALGLRTYEDDGETVNFKNELAVWKWVLETSLVQVSEPAWTWCRQCFMSHSGQFAPTDGVAEMHDLSPPSETAMRWR